MFEADDSFMEEIVSDFVAECSDMIAEVETDLLSSERIDIEMANKLFRPIHSLKGSSGSLNFNVIMKVAHRAEEFLTQFQHNDIKNQPPAYKDFFLSFFDFIRTSFSIIIIDQSDVTMTEEGEKLVAEVENLIKGISTENDGHVEADKVSESVDDDNNESDNISFALDQEMIDSFVSESNEIFQRVEELFLELIEKPTDKEKIFEVFRLMHSFKGNCGIFSLKDLESLGHKIETFLEFIRDEKIPPTPAAFETSLSLLDVLKDTLAKLSVDFNQSQINGIDLYMDILDQAMKMNSSSDENSSSDKKITETNDESVPENKTEELQVKKSVKTKTVTRSDIRVATTKLDSMNDLVGELVTVKTMLFEISKNERLSEGFAKVFRLFNRITTDLQDVSMSIRMVPIAGLFKRMIRIVHDISAKSGKEVDFTFTGEDTEIDKTVLERVTDPLVHMIRNAVDHGVELPLDREKVGKSAKGKVTLHAQNEASEIWITLKDDGKGIDPKFIYNKAVEKGVIENGVSLSEQDIYQLIFHPGFSTAKEVTDISGRGVGMDVVKTNIEQLGGRVEISSKLNFGTTFTIKIPLTLAVIQGMMLEASNQIFTIPMEVISESIQYDEALITSPIESSPLINIRGEFIPIIYLGEVLKLGNSSISNQSIVVVVDAKNGRYGLLVDKLVGQHETVIKPLPAYLKNNKCISGCSILGTGDASLIVDINGVADFVTNKVKIEEVESE